MGGSIHAFDYIRGPDLEGEAVALVPLRS